MVASDVHTGTIHRRKLFMAQQKPSSLCFFCKLCLAMALHLIIFIHSFRSGLEFGSQTKT